MWLINFIKSLFKKKKEVVVIGPPVIVIEDGVPEHYQIALDFLGTKEIRGSKHNPLIEEMFKLVVGREHSDETAWCAAFVGACLIKAGLDSTGKLNARSYLKMGDDINTPEIGDIVIFWRGSKSGWKGHVAFYAGEEGNYILCLGGNQSNRVSIAKYPKSRLLGYRRI